MQGRLIRATHQNANSAWRCRPPPTFNSNPSEGPRKATWEFPDGASPVVGCKTVSLSERSNGFTHGTRPFVGSRSGGKLKSRIDARKLLGHGGHCRADLLFGMRAGDEEPQSGGAFFHRRIENRLHVDAALEQRVRQAQRVAELPVITGTTGVLLLSPVLSPAAWLGGGTIASSPPAGPLAPALPARD